MTQFKVLMAIPKREQHHRIIDFLQEKEHVDGILRYISCTEDFSQFTYGIEDSVDTLSIDIVEDCKRTHDTLSKSWFNYHCIVFDLEEQCFTTTFFEHKKNAISQKLPIVKLVSGTSEDPIRANLSS